jgi:glycosyltransferase involved in cell wall biosynthesis
MRVLLVTPSYAAEPTGQHARINDVLRHHVITECGVRVEVVPFQWDAYTESKVAQRTLDIHFSPGSRFRRARTVLKTIVQRRERVDVIHVVDLPPFIGVASCVAAAGRPLVLGPNIAGRMFPREVLDAQTLQRIREEKWNLWRRWSCYGERLERWKLRGVDMLSADGKSFVCFSEFMQNILELRGIPRRKTRPLPSGVDRKIFYPAVDKEDPSEGAFELLFVGKPTKRKGVDILVGAVRELERRGREVRLRFAGADSTAVAALVDQRLSDSIEFTGRIPREQLPEHYRRADAYVIPSFYELESTSMIEALSCGTPCVATDDDSFREVGRSGSCVFFEKGNTEALANAVEQLICEYPAYRASAMKHAPTYDIADTHRSLMEIYQTLA